MTGTHALSAAIADAASRDQPATVALMRILMEAETEADARRDLTEAIAVQDGDQAADRLRTVERLWQDHPNAWQVVRTTIGEIAHDGQPGSSETTLRYWAETFDKLVAVSPEASVALYSLGNPALLAATTDEIVTAMRRWGLLGQDRDGLDFGCGIGRFTAALAPELRSVLGLDISAGMVAEARLRCAPYGNARFAVGTGRDLEDIPSLGVDLILAADVFPYLVQAGETVLEAIGAEMRRVLRPAGHLLILNYAYRDDLDRDRRDIADWAARFGFTVERNGTREFTLWDGSAFLLRRSAKFGDAVI